eukprot:363433-Chlamydomonas_euryale.AAC.28
MPVPTPQALRPTLTRAPQPCVGHHNPVSGAATLCRAPQPCVSGTTTLCRVPQPCAGHHTCVSGTTTSKDP